MTFPKTGLWIVVLLNIFVAVSAVRAEDYALLVSGQGGDDVYAREFSDSILRIRKSLIDRRAYPSENIRLLLDRADSPASGTQTASLENIRREFKFLSDTMKTSDSLLVIMIGHGMSDYVDPIFNLPGPDLKASDLAGIMEDLGMKRQKIILSFGCSGHFSEFLARPGRIILSSGDGPRQIYTPVMTGFLVQALEDASADINQDGRLAFYELFEFLSGEVTGFYEMKGQIQTENPALEDNGDGEVTTLAEGMDAGDGLLSMQIFVDAAFSQGDGAK
jgi:hypothetical protein